MSRFRIAELRIGTPVPFGPRGEPSAIARSAVAGPRWATATGLAGDVPGDPLRHGGPDKALHAYPAAHYPRWAADLPDAAGRFAPGAFGENLVVEGVEEADICLGDRWQAGEVLLEVSQGRQPCWKLNPRFGLPDMARRVQSSGRTGWYFRVLAEGALEAGMQARLIRRPHPDWPLVRVSELLYRAPLDRAALAAFAALPGLPESWRSLARNRLASGTVEDWQARLATPAPPG
ncbi:MAG: MOSC domain-containing protein [Roseovarius sp.]